MVPPLLDEGGVSGVTLVPRTGPDSVGADHHLAGVLILFSTLHSFPPPAVIIMGIAEGHLGVDVCQADLGIPAGAKPLLLGHGHELGMLVEEHSHVVGLTSLSPAAYRYDSLDQEQELLCAGDFFAGLHG